MIISDFSQITIYKDSQPVSGVMDFEVTESPRFIQLYEYHNDEPYASVSRGRVYELIIRLYSDSFFTADEGFTLSIVSSAQTITFSDCRISSVTVKNEGHLVNVIRITSEKRMIE